MKKAMLILAAALMTLAPVTASAAIRRGVIVRPYYGGFYRPYWGPYWGAYWGPYWGYSNFYDAHPNTGEVKLETKVKDAQVFINGSYAGTTKENKTMYLREGSYNIEIREGDATPFAQRVYVTPGKTVKLYPEL